MTDKENKDDRSSLDQLAIVITKMCETNEERRTTMTVDELMNYVLRVCPDATWDTDLDGQLVIYTDLNPDRDQNLHPARKGDK